MKELLVFSINKAKYGVWKESGISIKELETLHRIPLSPAYISGISIVNGRTVTLADLAVCIGFPSTTKKKQGQILLISEQEKVFGFVIEGLIQTMTVNADQIFPVPGFFKTSVIDTCVVIHDEPVPVINVSLLMSSIQQGIFHTALPEFPVAGTGKRNLLLIKKIRFFEAGNEFFAAPAADIGKDPVSRPRISYLPYLPRFMTGMAYQNGTVIPVISLSGKLDLPKTGTQSQIFQSEIGSTSFGFLIDSSEGVSSSGGHAVRPLPALAQSSWMTAAALRQGEILPLIDLNALMAADTEDEIPIPERYAPDSSFSALFGRSEVEVVEFSLLGARHALPKIETGEKVPIKAARQVPNVQPILIGVVEHQGELLPVLDLAMCFGRRSRSSPEWQMLLVKNGTFRAFIITEAVFGERRLSPEGQREVPLMLPHQVVYGCYPDDASVRLILNVEALAVHFDKALVQGFLPALSKSMEQAPAEIVPALLDVDFDKPQNESVQAESEPEKEREEAVFERPAVSVERNPDEPVLMSLAGQVEAPASPVSIGNAETKETIVPLIEPPPERVLITSGQMPETSREPAVEDEQKTGDEAQPEIETEPEREDDEKPGPDLKQQTQSGPEIGPQAYHGSESEREPESEPEYQLQPDPELGQGPDRKELEPELHSELQPGQGPESTGEDAVSEQIPLPVSTGSKESGISIDQADQPDEIDTDGVSDAEQSEAFSGVNRTSSEESHEAISPAGLPKQEAEEAIAEAHSEAREEEVTVTVPAPEKAATISAEEPKFRETVCPEPIAASSRIEKEEVRGKRASAKQKSSSVSAHDNIRRDHGGYRTDPGRIIAGYVSRSSQSRSRKRKYLFAGIIAALIFVLFLAGVFRRTGPIREAQGPRVERVVAEKPRPGIRLSRKPFPTEPPKPSADLRAFGEPIHKLILPGSTVYVVRKGDTLWAISERFTGNPFNYPRLARENNIPNPDLIYPGQVIRL